MIDAVRNLAAWYADPDGGCMIAQRTPSADDQASGLIPQPAGAPFFHVISRGDTVSTFGVPVHSDGHHIEGAQQDEGIFAEWRWDGAQLDVRTDRYGVWPLFYFAHAGEICISPSLLTLVSRGAPKEPDYDALAAFLRLGFFATLENPEPRYTVEIFPFLMILAGAGAALIKASAKATETDAVPMVE